LLLFFFLFHFILLHFFFFFFFQIINLICLQGGDTPESSLKSTPERGAEHSSGHTREVLRINLRFTEEDPYSHALETAFQLWMREQVRLS
jgi:hypothetical protein